jgi:acyl-CoA reductase-like NAD-dependent aldehyde dehydrogenase
MAKETKTKTEAANAMPEPRTGDAPLQKPRTKTQTRGSGAKAYKMYVGGAFIRSESGRYFQVNGAKADDDVIVDVDADPEVVNIPRGSRKDVRDAVLKAKGALAGWEGRSAFNRGQILYRLAEVMESRKPELVQSVVRGGVPEVAAMAEVEASIDRAIFYAGFADKFHSLLSSYNPVAGPHFDFSVPEPMGVICVVAPEKPALLGLVSTVLPVVCGGNTVVALASAADPRTAIVWSECLATSDLPSGVINVLTGQQKELAPHVSKHREVIGVDAWIVDADLRKSVEADAADNVKRVKTHVPMDVESWLDDRKGQGLGWIERFLETKTIWHPVGIGGGGGGSY